MPWSRQQWRRLAAGGRLALIVAAVVAGALLIVDRPGLEARYYALGEPWEGDPYHVTVDVPALAEVDDILDALATRVHFSVRWRGWWYVDAAGEHRFTLTADDAGAVRIDGEQVVASARRSAVGAIELAPGLHRVEIDLRQSHGESRLDLGWVPPGGDAASPRALPADDLYAGRPLALRRALRGGLAGWSRPWRQVAGAMLLLAALLAALVAARGPASRAVEALGRRWRRVDGPAWRAALLLALFVAAFVAVLPYTGTIRGGDDTAYLSAAEFNARKWFLNRYGHVYLLKAFIAVGGGDPFLGVRLWWSFVFAGTVAALAVAVRSVGDGLQLRTLAVVLFVFFSQTTIFGLIGAGFADFSAMLFVTAATAVAMHGFVRPGATSGRGKEWHALAIGVLTVAAMRSKEVGAVALLLPALFLVADGRLDLRRFARRLAWWGAGAAGVLALVAALDGIFLGDLFFGLDETRLTRTSRMNFPSKVPLRAATAGWLELIREPLHREGNFALRNLWLAVAAAAIAAGVAGRRLGLRLLHLLPIAYLAALVAVYVRLPHPFSGRMLITILPVAALMAGLLPHYAGLDALRWRTLLRPAVLLPTGLAAALAVFVLLPWRLGELSATAVVPAELVRRFGWRADHFVTAVAVPLLLFAATAVVAFAARRRRYRVAALVVAYLVAFGPGFELTRASLAKKIAVLKSDLLLYPWRTFREQLDAHRPGTLAFSPDLQWRYGMSAPTRRSIGRMVLDHPTLQVSHAREMPKSVHAAIVSRPAYDLWRRQRPGLAPYLERTAVWDGAGVLVFLRPLEARQLAAAERRRQREAAAGPAAGEDAGR